MSELKKERILLEKWYPETDTFGWLPFDVKDIDFLMEKKIIGIDSLGAAMKDQEAFEKALLKMTELNRAFTYSELVSTYLSLTTEDIRIKA